MLNLSNDFLVTMLEFVLCVEATQLRFAPNATKPCTWMRPKILTQRRRASFVTTTPASSVWDAMIAALSKERDLAGRSQQQETGKSTQRR